MKELIEIQNKLKVPKNSYNSFGRYKFRNSEAILEAIKPLLLEHECLLTTNQEVTMIGNKFFIATSARISKGDKFVFANGFAEIADKKAGMSAEQVTGSASSYSKKYALGNLFLIDDTADSDATNDHGKSKPNATVYPSNSIATEAQIKRMFAIAYSKGLKNNDILDMMESKFNKHDSKRLTVEETNTLIDEFEADK